MLHVIMLILIMLSVIMQILKMLILLMLSVIMQILIKLLVIMLILAMLRVIMLILTILRVIMLTDNSVCHYVDSHYPEFDVGATFEMRELNTEKCIFRLIKIVAAQRLINGRR